MKIPGFRYVIAVLLLLATTVNYADRLMLSVVSPQLREELNLSSSDYGQIVAMFMFAYAIMYAGSGPIADWLGTRRSFALFVSIWSLAAIGHAFAVGKWSLAFWRFLLGLGEPGNWPAAAKAVGEWFPPEQRALGVGLFNAGSSLGSAIAPPMVVFLTIHFGWRAAFVFTGSLGLIWLVAWLLLYQPPHKSRFITPGEKAFLEGRVQPPQQTTAAPFSWRAFGNTLRVRECYALVVARFFTDPVMYFVIFWLPEYLKRERNFDLATVGKLAWIPFVFGDIGYVLGGWISGWFMRRGVPLPRARQRVLLAAGLLMPISMMTPFVSEAWMAIALTSVITFAHALWTSNLQTLPTDLFPGWRVGTVMGLSGMGGAIGGVLANYYTGDIVDRFSFKPLFVGAGLMHPIAFVIVSVLLARFFASKRSGQESV